MSISMIGIDHSMAPVDIRALFAFTRKNAGEAMEKLKEQRGIDGCIILSTCNRLEVWASVDDEAELSLYKESSASSSTLAHTSRRLHVERIIQPSIPRCSFNFSIASPAFFLVNANKARISTGAILWSIPIIEILILCNSP